MLNNLKINHKAPEFELPAYYQEKTNITVKSSDFAGKWIVLFFYPADFTGICGSEVEAFQKELKLFEERKVQVIGCSTDSIYSHQEWAKKLGGIDYYMLSDKHHATSIDYNVFVDEAGMSLRGTFIIDPEGNLRWYCISDMSIGRSTEEVLRTLDALQSGQTCMANWKK
jgi:alkyl hydroperoxide reductase subunit AhpC